MKSKIYIALHNYDEQGNETEMVVFITSLKKCEIPYKQVIFV